MIHSARLWCLRLADRIGVTGKIMGIILGLTAFFGLGFTIYLRTSTRVLLVEQLESRGQTIAQGVATRAIEPVLMGNEYALHNLLEETRQINPDVRYILVISQRGEVLGDTFTRRIPVGLVDANSVGKQGEPQVVAIGSEEGLVRDVAYSLFGGKGGSIRVGISERAIAAELNRQTIQLLLATLAVSLVGVWAAYRLSHLLGRPVRALVDGTTRVAAGDLGVQVPVYSGDEIGQLAEAFNTMTARIAWQYQEISQFSQQVLRDNADLVALNGITAGLNRLYHIQTLPSVASRMIVRQLGVDAGTILLWNQGRESWDPEPNAGLEPLVRDAVRTRKVCVQDGTAVVPLRAGRRLLGVVTLSGQPQWLATDRCRNFLQTIGNHLTVALENARLLSELTEKQRVLTHLFDRAVSAQEEERKRISRELHDETSQSITSLMLGLRAVEEAGTPDEMRQNVRTLRERLLTALNSVHQMARRLRPTALDDLGLSAALQRHVKELEAQTGVDIDLDMAGLGSQRLSTEIETAVYRIVQEALANALRHSGGTELSVVVERQDGTVIAMVEDNGTGFDVASTAAGNRLGLSGMRERARLLGGRLSVESEPGVGTTVCLRIPFTIAYRGDDHADSDRSS